QLHLEPVELHAGGQLAVPEQVADLLEGRLARQLVDVVAAVGETAVLAVEIAQTGLGRDPPLQTPAELTALGHRCLLSERRVARGRRRAGCSRTVYRAPTQRKSVGVR